MLLHLISEKLMSQKLMRSLINDSLQMKRSILIQFTMTLLSLGQEFKQRMNGGSSLMKLKEFK